MWFNKQIVKDRNLTRISEALMHKTYIYFFIGWYIKHILVLVTSYCLFCFVTRNMYTKHLIIQHSWEILENMPSILSPNFNLLSILFYFFLHEFIVNVIPGRNQIMSINDRNLITMKWNCCAIIFSNSYETPIFILGPVSQAGKAG